MINAERKTYFWSPDSDPDTVQYIAFLNSQVPKDFWKPRKRKMRRPDGRPGKAIWREIRDRIFARDDYTCRYCGTRGRALECDHVVAHSRGGPSDDSNLVTACLPCNRSKRAKTLEEWGGRETHSA